MFSFVNFYLARLLGLICNLYLSLASSSGLFLCTGHIETVSFGHFTLCAPGDSNQLIDTWIKCYKHRALGPGFLAKNKYVLLAPCPGLGQAREFSRFLK